MISQMFTNPDLNIIFPPIFIENEDNFLRSSALNDAEDLRFTAQLVNFARET